MKENILIFLSVTINTLIAFIYMTLIAGAFEVTLTIFIATYIAMFIVSIIAFPILYIEMAILSAFYDFFIKKQKVF